MIKVNIRKVEVLDEAKEDDVWAKYGSKIEHKEDWDYLVSWIGADRSNRIKFLLWGTKWLVSASERAKDSYYEYASERLVNTLTKFQDFNSSFKKKDINQYKNIEELEQAYKTDVLGKRISKAKKKREKDPEWAKDPQNSMAIYEDDRFFVVRPVSLDGSCFFGKNTKWCIGQEGNEYFDQYTREGNVFYFVKDDAARENDQFAYVAIQADADGISTMWDRDDDQHHIDQIWDLGWPEESVTNFMREIEEHVEDYPPEDHGLKALQELEHAIYNGEHNTRHEHGHLHFYAEMQEYDHPYYLTLDAVFVTKLMIPLPEGSTDLDVLEVLEEWEEEISEKIQDMSPVDEFADQGNHGEKFVELFFRKMGEGLGVTIEMNLRENDNYGYSEASDVESSIEYFKDNFGSDDAVEDMRERMEKIFTETIYANMSSPGRDRYMDIHKDIEKIENSFKHIYAIWEEDEPEVGISMVLGGNTDWSCPVFNPEAPKAADEIAQIQYDDQWKRHLRTAAWHYHGDIREIVEDWDHGIEKIFTDAVASFADEAAAFAQKQIRIDFPDLKLPPMGQEFVGMKTSGFHKFKTLVPGQETLRNIELVNSQRISWRGILEFSWADTLPEIDAAMKWAQYIDKHYKNIHEKMQARLAEVKDKINKAHESRVHKIYLDFKERIDHLRNMGIMSENRKRIKIKVQKR